VETHTTDRPISYTVETSFDQQMPARSRKEGRSCFRWMEVVPGLAVTSQKKDRGFIS
jgi:hypothetical protein